MRLFALETDKNKIIQRFCHSNECVKVVTYYHGLSFLFATLKDVALTIGFVALGGLALYFGFYTLWSSILLFVAWFFLAFLNIFKAWIDWCYDMIIVTTDKVILVDQTSFFKQEVTPIHLDNLGSITAETQFWNIFPFGAICFHLKEGLGGDSILKKYIPDAQSVAGAISESMTAFEKSQQAGRSPSPTTSAPAKS